MRKYPQSVISLKSKCTTGRVCPEHVRGICFKLLAITICSSFFCLLTLYAVCRLFKLLILFEFDYLIDYFNFFSDDQVKSILYYFYSMIWIGNARFSVYTIFFIINGNLRTFVISQNYLQFQSLIYLSVFLKLVKYSQRHTIN